MGQILQVQNPTTPTLHTTPLLTGNIIGAAIPASTPSSSGGGVTGPSSPSTTLQATATAGVTAPSTSSGDYVPATMPRTGIMYVRKDNKKYVLLTPTTKTAKESALKRLGTNEGIICAGMIRNSKMSISTARSYAAHHYLRFVNGSKLTQGQWDRVQAALGAPGAVTAINVTGANLTLTDLQEAQDAADQTASISDQANQQLEETEKELAAWKKAFEDAQDQLAQGQTTREEVNALLEQVNNLTQQLQMAQQVADEARIDAEEAEAQVEVIDEALPWYQRYKWHIGGGVLAIALAGGAYWFISRRPRPVAKNKRLPAPTSPKHPAGF